MYFLGNKVIQTFFKGNSPKVNLTIRLEFEHAYYDVTVMHVSRYAMGGDSFFSFLNFYLTFYYFLKKPFIGYLIISLLYSSYSSFYSSLPRYSSCRLYFFFTGLLFKPNHCLKYYRQGLFFFRPLGFIFIISK